MLLNSWVNTKGALRVELMDGGLEGRCYRFSDQSGEFAAVMTRAEVESLRDQLNALLPAQPLKVAA